MSTLKEFVTSKKAIVFFSTVAVMFLSTQVGLSEADAEHVVQLAMAYLVGQGLADVGKEKKA